MPSVMPADDIPSPWKYKEGDICPWCAKKPEDEKGCTTCRPEIYDDPKVIVDHSRLKAAFHIFEDCEDEAQDLWNEGRKTIICTLCKTTPANWKPAKWWDVSKTTEHLMSEPPHPGNAYYYNEDDTNRWSLRTYKGQDVALCPNCMYGNWYTFTPQRWEVRRPKFECVPGGTDIAVKWTLEGYDRVIHQTHHADPDYRKRWDRRGLKNEQKLAEINRIIRKEVPCPSRTLAKRLRNIAKKSHTLWTKRNNTCKHLRQTPEGVINKLNDYIDAGNTDENNANPPTRKNQEQEK